MNRLLSYIAEGEHKYQEFKEKYARTIFKTISAFANNHDGRILFGVKDDGYIVGIDDSKELRINLENAINDSILPRPYYEIDVIKYDNKDVLILEIYKGLSTPYTYNNKAYERYDTSTVEVDRDKYDELVLLGKNISYEELPYNDSNLKFSALQKLLSDNLDIQTYDLNIMKSLGLYKQGKYNIAAALLADTNRFDRIGMDIIRYSDESMQLVDDRISLSKVSILTLYETSISFFEKYIKQKDVINGEKRITFMEVPKTAFREALVNAIIHRDYNREANNRIEFFPDRIEILSVGSLPIGTSEEEYIRGSYSNARNRLLADVFFRIGFIEKMGTGIRRIKQSYSKFSVEPSFEVMQHSIRVVLPMITISDVIGSQTEKSIDYDVLNVEALKLYNYILSTPSLARSDVESYMKVGKTKANKLVNELIDCGLVQKIGQGRIVRYRAK